MNQKGDLEGAGAGEIMPASMRSRENTRLRDDIVELMNRRMSLTKRLHRYIEGTFNQIQVMSAIAYALGVLLIVTALLYYFLTEQRLEALGFSALGAAETVAVFIYQPIQRTQNALGDFSQHTIVLHAWNTQVALKMLHMKINEKGSVDEVADYIQKITRELAGTIETLTEKHPPASTREEGSGQ